MSLDHENVKESSIKGCFERNSDVVKHLYKDFEDRLTGNGENGV